MSKKVTPIPRGYRTATPSLIVTDVSGAIEFYQHAFSASLVNHVLDETESFPVHATIKIGNSLLILMLEAPLLGMLSPISTGGNPGQTHLYLEDVDAVWHLAMEQGAVSITEPIETLWGDRSGLLMDPYGHIWSLASRVEMVSKVELQKRVSESRQAFLPKVELENQSLESMV